MKKVLIIGSGAREHILGETLLKSPQEVAIAVFGASLNPALKEISQEYHCGSLKDFDALKDFAGRFNPDFAIIGPEDPLENGIVDFLKSINIPSVGPSQVLAQIESSKTFARDLLAKFNIPGNPIFKNFTSAEGVLDFMEELNGEYVIKADVLKGGKGVKLSGEHFNSPEEGLIYAMQCINEDGSVLIEEKFVGEEFSLICFVDGENLIPCPLAQDHKRAHEGDTGSNTGGMGSYSDSNHLLPFLTEDDFNMAMDINQAVVKAIKEETGEAYKGFLYGGFMAVKNGVRLIEYNARFGDPEVMNMLGLLKSDFLAICEAIIAGNLNEVEIEFERKASVIKYIVPNGYPDDSVKNEKVSLSPLPEGINLYFGSVEDKESDLYLLGSRAFGVLGKGETIYEAEKLVEEAMQSIKGPVFNRKDIGTKELVQKRIDHMQRIRA